VDQESTHRMGLPSTESPGLGESAIAAANKSSVDELISNSSPAFIPSMGERCCVSWE